jgi:hypothetical protein
VNGRAEAVSELDRFQAVVSSGVEGAQVR